ncbi:MAG TPA: hypothetical protein VG291_00075 [Xanthobacteraceae bacterium]|nr:hypothetical protein [Xanthobacteraceae bacterium]
MSELRDFVADLLESKGAVIEALDPEALDVLAPAPMQKAMGWPELARLGFGTERAHGAIPIGLEGDWLDRFGALLGDEGRWSAREVRPAVAVAAPSDPERLLGRTLDLPNAVWRFQSMAATTTRCLLLGFRYTAVSDEKREGLIWLGFNLGTGAVVNDILARLRPALAQMPEWLAPDQAARLVAGPGWSAATLDARVRPLLDQQMRDSMEPFLRAMRRRLDRDRNRVHAYHDDLRVSSLNRLAALARAQGEKAEADRRRETLRVEAIEREYRAKLDDLRHNYALRVTVEWVQALDLYLPVQRFEVLIRRRKGERVIRLDWHPLVKAVEPPLCEAGLGLDRVRLVCDDKLHLTEPAGQAPCRSCGKPFCRACSPAACSRCGQASANN